MVFLSLLCNSCWGLHTVSIVRNTGAHFSAVRQSCLLPFISVEYEKQGEITRHIKREACALVCCFTPPLCPIGIILYQRWRIMIHFASCQSHQWVLNNNTGSFPLWLRLYKDIRIRWISHSMIVERILKSLQLFNLSKRICCAVTASHWQVLSTFTQPQEVDCQENINIEIHWGLVCFSGTRTAEFVQNHFCNMRLCPQCIHGDAVTVCILNLLRSHNLRWSDVQREFYASAGQVEKK